MITNDGYILSNNIKVFPCAYRGEYDNGVVFDPEARLTSEYNLTNSAAISSTSKWDNDVSKSYIINFDTTANKLKCVIHGYLFEINYITLDDFVNTVDGTTKKAWIKLKDITLSESNDTTNITKVLDSFTGSTSLDEQRGTDYIFTGLLISANTPTGAEEGIEIVKLVGDGDTKTPCLNKELFFPVVSHGSGTSSLVINRKSSSTSDASGEGSLVIGNSNEASGKYSIAAGDNTKADKDNLVAIGTFNATADNDLFVVGNGSSDTNRSNVLEVKTDAVNINEDTTITGNTTISGTEALSGDFSINTDKFKVTASSGTTDIKGNLNIKKDVTSESGETTTETKISFEADTGDASINGNTTIGGTATISGDLTIGTNKFTVAADSGNTTIDGTADITGAATIGGNLTVDTNRFTVEAGSGNTTIAGTLTQSDATNKAQVTFNGNVDALNGLDVTGTLTSSDKLTVSSNGAEITGPTTITGNTTIGGQITLGEKVILAYDETNKCLRIKVNN